VLLNWRGKTSSKFNIIAQPTTNVTFWRNDVAKQRHFDKGVTQQQKNNHSIIA